MQRLKVAFAGTPEFAAHALQAIIDAGFEVPLVLTQPDRPAGRGMNLQASAVKNVALAHGIAVDQPEKLRTPEQQASLRAAQPDVLVVAAYGLILPQAVLDIPHLGCINIHASLLPRWRGAAPIHRAIEAGDATTGITLMYMDAGLDTGDMLATHSLPIDDCDTTASLHDKLAALGAQMIVELLPQLAAGGVTRQVQPSAGVTYAHKIAKAESQLDFRQDAALLARRLRAFNPYPGGVAQIAGTPIKLWAGEACAGSGEPGRILAADANGIVVACGQGALRLTELQKPGGKRLAAQAFLQSFALPSGQSFDPPEQSSK